MGKYNFTERWKSVSPFGEIDHQKGGMIQMHGKRIKPFNCNMDPDNNLFMKLKQFREQHRSKDYMESSSE